MELQQLFNRELGSVKHTVKKGGIIIVMNDILIYSDSLILGMISDSRERLPFKKRWSGSSEAALKENGFNLRVIENFLNGRITVWKSYLKLVVMVRKIWLKQYRLILHLN